MKRIGQFFTKNIDLQENLLKFILCDPDVILEPSVGEGHLVEFVSNNTNGIMFDMFEIDNTLTFKKIVREHALVIGDFLKEKITKKYKTIIGNPPYLKSKTGNLYIDFIKKCFEFLEDSGELVFIIPSDFFQVKMSSGVITQMTECGAFTHIYYPNNEKLFENASIDVLIFRYCKDNSIDKRQTLYNGIMKKSCLVNGMLTFSETSHKESVLLSDIFDIYVGMVSGKESVFKNEELGNVIIINGETNINKYILIDSFPTDNEPLNEYLLSYKKDLLDRRIRKFSEKNWFEWGALRNFKTIQEKIGQDCIYIKTLTRDHNVAFKSSVSFCGGSLITLVPKIDKKIDLVKVVLFLNTSEFKNKFKFSERYKIGHRQISNSYIHCGHI